ncbi:hypothetical protein [Fusobacterium sp. SYSU M8D902]|uniref:hypothetical protein n=1 Tax=Fusobacterium sp. SYSU M8D902 TaxID=3159562 RepID=UPI0032E46D19
MKKILLGFLLISSIGIAESIPAIPIIPILPPIEGEVGKPDVPTLPTEDKIESDGRIRKLEKNTTVLMNVQLKVEVPLEIISDVDIEAMVIDDMKLEIPFEIELNKKPEKKDYYKIKFSENKIDIDSDGQIDTTIYTPPYINTKIVKDNMVYIDGAKISKEGKHSRKVYMTVEVRE